MALSLESKQALEILRQLATDDEVPAETRRKVCMDVLTLNGDTLKRRTATPQITEAQFVQLGRVIVELESIDKLGGDGPRALGDPSTPGTDKPLLSV